MDIPHAKVAQPDVVASLVAYLVSTEAHFITGEFSPPANVGFIRLLLSVTIRPDDFHEWRPHISVIIPNSH